MPSRNLQRQLGRIVQSCLTDDLLNPRYRKIQGKHKHCGHCYVASEAMFHLIGGFASNYRPRVIRHEGGTHWFLEERTTGEVIDLTKAQFLTKVPYKSAKWCGFLTRQPSKRAQSVLNRAREKSTSGGQKRDCSRLRFDVCRNEATGPGASGTA